MKNYTYTNNFNEATHWMPTNDNDAHWDWTHVTIGKLYKLNYDNKEDEYYIIDDEGYKSLIFLCHNGDLIIVEEID